MEVHSSQGCGGQSINIMTTTGVAAFESEFYRLTGSTPFNADAISTFRQYAVSKS